MKKKLFALVLAVLLPIGLLAGSGDVNGDGKIDAADIVELLSYIEDRDHPSSLFKLENADLDRDGKVTTDDVGVLARKILKPNKDYILALSNGTVVLDNDHLEFDVYMETDLDANNINIEVSGNDNMSIYSPNGKENTSEEGVYKWHFEVWSEQKNYSGKDWEAKIYFYYNGKDVRDSVKVIYKSDELPKLNVSSTDITVDNKENGRIDYIDFDYNYEWLKDNLSIEVLNNEDSWITRTWIEDKKLGFEYDENYTDHNRTAQIVLKNDEHSVSETINVSIESGGLASLSVSPKTIRVKNKEYGRDIILERNTNPKWLDVQVEYEGNEDGWLSQGGDMEGKFHFYYNENYTGKDRTCKIKFKNEKYNLYDEVEVTSVCADWVEILPDDLPERYVRAQKREYNLIGIGSKNVKRLQFGMVLRTGGIESQDDIGCEILEGSDWLELGPITMLGCYFSYTRNNTDAVKKAKVRLYDKKEGYEDVVTVNSLPVNFQHVNDQNMAYIQPGGDEIEFVLKNGAGMEAEAELQPQQRDGVNYEPGSSGYVDYIHHLSTEKVGNDLHFRFKIDANDTDEQRWQVVAFPVRFTEASRVNDGCQTLHIGQAPKSAPTAAQMRQALTDLYNSTDGPNWYRNDGWCTDKPMSQWDLLERAGLGDYVFGIPLDGNGLKGTIPESFSTLFEAAFDVFFHNNGLYGRIPQSAIDHPAWEKVGWNVVVQNLWPERRLLEYDDLKLKLPTYEIDHVNGNLKTSDELFAKNKVNVVMIGTPSEEMANLHLAYHNKGYGTIVSAYGWLGGTREGPEEAAREFPIKDIDFLWECPWAYDKLFGLTAMGTWYVFDDKSNLLACYVRDWSIPEEWYASKVDSICRKFLGEPEEHEAYNEYTSQDYSKDGTVKKLQSATVGKGVDLVFLGECFIDKDMDEGGEYDKQIAEAVEQFFSEEPYKSLRNRFNVWQVKCVAPKGKYGQVSTYAIKEDDAKAFDYAKKAVGDDAELMFVNVIYKGSGGTTLDVNRSHTSMYYGSYVAYDYQGGRVINHEGGGHGLALLADEYVEQGNEDAVFDEGSCNYLDNLWETYGYGANVDWRSNPSQVRWAHFINDERYADEHIGVYEGAHLAGKGCYRPTENSMMRYNDCGFNAPSREAIYKRVMKLSEGDDWEYDYETFVAFDAPAREAYKAAQSRSESRGTSAQQRRIESRPPTIYKGTWRDAGKCEKIEYDKRQSN